jgi:hypothetical protein
MDNNNESLPQIILLLDHYKRMYDLYYQKLIQRLDHAGISKQSASSQISHDPFEEMNIFKP